jgi:hypothetical protein
MVSAEFGDATPVAKSVKMRHLAMLLLRSAQFTRLGSKNPDQGRNGVTQHPDLTTQMLAIAALIETLVKLLIQSGVMIERGVTLDGSVERVYEPVDGVCIVRRRSFGRQLSGARLKHRAHIENILDFITFQRYDEIPAARFEFDEPFRRQTVEGFTHRKPT